jgi:hypothetical protein
MTPDQAERLITAAENIANHLSDIRFELNADDTRSAVSHLIKSIDASGIELSLDREVAPAIRAIAAQVEEAQAIR